MVLLQGNNGHGKSNLLEAVYLLVIAKSQRASTERELVRRESVGVEFFSQVAAVVQREDGPVRFRSILRIPSRLRTATMRTTVSTSRNTFG